MRKNNSRSKILAGSAFLLVFAFSLTAVAQDYLPEPSAFFIELSPTDAPGPNEDITASLSGFSFDLNRAEITWLKNGRVETKGLGATRYGFRTGESGEKINLQALATDSSGIRHETGLTFTVAGVDLLWQADTYAPAWYKGKKLPSPRSNITVSAFPQLTSAGKKISSRSLIFRWSLDDSFKESQSGAGKDIFRFTAGPAAGIAHDVELEVSSVDGEIKARKKIAIGVVSPQIIAYEEDALSGPKTGLGLKDSGESFILAGEEKTFRAVPFFFSLSRGSGNFEYLWRLDGKPVGSGGEPNTLRLKSSSDARGAFSIEILVKNLNNILQEINQNFGVNVI
ncbi:MAG: hypothetical protein HY446_00185 [Candidatus Niyogibacteria bacterium]|nr:hypothetical protein [Candidatus Niyogibacteria bacterium]